MADLLVGHLVPLSNHVQEDASIPKIPLSRGRNSIGRNSAPSLTDKRLSRNHLSLTAAAAEASSADLVVEGSNPVVVTSGNDRKKLYHKESMTIRDGDIIELIPGQYIFQYRKLCGDSYEKSSNGEEKAEESSRKRSHQLECGENGSNLKRFKGEVEGKSDDGGGRVEAIRHFRVPKDKLPQTFRLLNVQGLPPWANTSCVSIKDVIQGDILFAVLSNYMVDLDWLIPACPTVAKMPHVLVVHGEGDGTLDYMKVCFSSTHVDSVYDMLSHFLCLGGTWSLICYLSALEKETCNLDSAQTTIAYFFHLGHTIQRPCFLFILEE